MYLHVQYLCVGAGKSVPAATRPEKYANTHAVKAQEEEEKLIEWDIEPSQWETQGLFVLKWEEKIKKTERELARRARGTTRALSCRPQCRKNAAELGRPCGRDKRLEGLQQ